MHPEEPNIGPSDFDIVLLSIIESNRYILQNFHLDEPFPCIQRIIIFFVLFEKSGNSRNMKNCCRRFDKR